MPSSKAKKESPQWFIDLGMPEVAHWRALREWWRAHGIGSTMSASEDRSVTADALQFLAWECQRNGLDAASVLALRTRRAVMRGTEALPPLLDEGDVVADVLELRLLAMGKRPNEVLTRMQKEKRARHAKILANEKKPSWQRKKRGTQAAALDVDESTLRADRRELGLSE